LFAQNEIGIDTNEAVNGVHLPQTKAAALKATAPGRALAAAMAAASERLAAHPAVQKVGTAAQELRQEAVKTAESVLARPGVQGTINAVEKATAPLATTAKKAAEAFSERNRLTTLGKELGKLDDLDAAKRADFGNKPPRFLGGKRASASELDLLSQELQKAGIKVQLNADAAIKKLDPIKGYAAFDYEKKILLLPSGVTQYGVFHERAHVRHFLEVGPEAYKAVGKFAREMRVYEDILKNKHLFSQQELNHAASYIEGLRDLKAYGKID
jgi:hypothetical protein